MSTATTDAAEAAEIRANTTRYNPRYVLWSQKHGNTPDEQMAADRDRWPGGCMCGFILWIQEEARRFCKEHPDACCGDTIWDQDAFTAHLTSVVQGDLS